MAGKVILNAAEEAAKKAQKQFKRIETWDKIYKGAGKVAVNEYRDMNLMTAGVMELGKKAFNKGKEMFRPVDYEKITKDGGSLLDLSDNIVPFKMKKEYQALLAAGIIGYGAADGAFQVHNKAKLGDIKGGQMANMINGGGSMQNLSQEETEQNLQRMGTKGSGSLDTYGAEADLVFALHNMR